MKVTLEPGTIYNVLIRGQKCIRRRVYKWSEIRFGSIPCHVFTAPVCNDVRAAYNPVTEELSITGRQVPKSEVSVPEYDLLLCEPHRNMKPL